jgi:hypothetical protein
MLPKHTRDTDKPELPNGEYFIAKRFLLILFCNRLRVKATIVCHYDYEEYDGNRDIDDAKAA